MVTRPRVTPPPDRFGPRVRARMVPTTTTTRPNSVVEAEDVPVHSHPDYSSRMALQSSWTKQPSHPGSETAVVSSNQYCCCRCLPMVELVRMEHCCCCWRCLGGLHLAAAAVVVVLFRPVRLVVVVLVVATVVVVVVVAVVVDGRRRRRCEHRWVLHWLRNREICTLDSNDGVDCGCGFPQPCAFPTIESFLVASCPVPTNDTNKANNTNDHTW